MKINLMLLLLGVISSEALFFNYPKNVLMNFFNSLHQKKELLRRPPFPNIHHYHLHYYPVHVPSFHSPFKTIQDDLETIHTNKFEHYGWNEQFRYFADPAPIIHHVPTVVEPFSTSESHVHHNPEIVESDVNDADKTIQYGLGEEPVAKSSTGVLVQVPLHQQIIIQHPVRVEKPKEVHPLLAFLQKLRSFKNSIFHSSQTIDAKSYGYPDHLNAFAILQHPQPRILR